MSIIIRLKALFGPRVKRAPEPSWSVCRVGSKKIGPGDIRHVDHKLWMRWRSGASLSQKSAPDSTQVSNEVKLERPRLTQEPTWSVCMVGQKRIYPDDTRHVDHALWQKWRRDLSKLTRDDVSLKMKPEGTIDKTMVIFEDSIEGIELEPVQAHKPRPVEESEDEKMFRQEQQRLRRQQYADGRQAAEDDLLAN